MTADWSSVIMASSEGRGVSHRYRRQLHLLRQPHQGAPGRRRVEVVGSDDENGSPGLHHSRRTRIQHPSLSPFKEPLGIAFEEPDAAMTGRIPGKGVRVERQTFAVAEVEVPTHEPVRVDGARPPVERQFNAKSPELVGLLRLPELTGPQRTRLPNS